MVVLLCFFITGCSTTYSDIKNDRISMVIEDLRAKTKEAVLMSVVVVGYYAQNSKWPAKVSDLMGGEGDVNQGFLEKLVIEKSDDYDFQLSKGPGFTPSVDTFEILFKSSAKDPQVIEGIINVVSEEYNYNVNLRTEYRYSAEGVVSSVY